MLRIFFLVFISTQLFAIVVVKPREVGEEPGVSGFVTSSLKTARGNTNTDDYTAAFSLQYDSNTTYLVWGVVNGEYGESNGTTNTNNVYGHLRYIQDIEGKRLAGELFTQLEENAFQDISERVLFGGGLRDKVLRQKPQWGGLFVGLGAMLEYIDYTSSINPAEHNIRLNSYLAYSLAFDTGSELVLSGYYQPKADEFSDFYVTVAGKVEIPIYKQLYFGVTLLYSYDSKPAIGVEDYDFTQQTILKYKF